LTGLSTSGSSACGFRCVRGAWDSGSDTPWGQSCSWGGADTISRWQAVAAISLLPLPGLADWTTQTLGWRYSNNPLRVLTGLAFGVAVVGFASLALHGHLKEAVLVALWYILLAVSACSVLNRAGCIEPLLRPYVDFLDGRVG